MGADNLDKRGRVKPRRAKAQRERMNMRRASKAVGKTPSEVIQDAVNRWRKEDVSS